MASLRAAVALAVLAIFALPAHAQPDYVSEAATPLELAHASESGIARFSGRVRISGRYVFCRYGDTDISARFVPDARSRRILPHPADAPPADVVYPENPDAFFALVFDGRSVQEVYGHTHRAARGRARIELVDYHVGAECGGWSYGATFAHIDLDSGPELGGDEEEDDDEDGCQP